MDWETREPKREERDWEYAPVGSVNVCLEQPLKTREVKSAAEFAGVVRRRRRRNGRKTRDLLGGKGEPICGVGFSWIKSWWFLGILRICRGFCLEVGLGFAFGGGAEGGSEGYY